MLCCRAAQLFWTLLWLPCSSTWGSARHGCAQVWAHPRDSAGSANLVDTLPVCQPCYLQNCATPYIPADQCHSVHTCRAVPLLVYLCRSSFIISRLLRCASSLWATAVCAVYVSAAGPFAVGVRELLGHYMVLEEQFMEDTTDMAMRIDEVVSVLGSVRFRRGCSRQHSEHKLTPNSSEGSWHGKYVCACGRVAWQLPGGLSSPLQPPCIPPWSCCLVAKGGATAYSSGV